jgi:hypothetical protein
MRRVLLILFASLFCMIVHADNVPVTSKLTKVNRTGYYKILLGPEVIAYSKPDYADIRLLDDKGEEIPFIFKEESPATSITGFKEYPILENQYQGTKKSSRVVIHNTGKDVISYLVLVIRNTDISKIITLRGSDDNKNWYIIQKALPSKMKEFDKTSGAFMLQFPQSNYEYLELTTIDKKNDPIQFIKVGYFDAKVSNGLYSPIAVSKLEQKDSSDKRSYISIRFDKNYEVSKFELVISGPEYYKRRMIAGNFNSYNHNKSFQSFSEYEISSVDRLSWNVDKIKVNELILIIENEDNKPLKVVGAKVYQLNKYLIAKLEEGKSYYVKTGDEKLTTPNYDLVYFSDSIPDSLTVVKTKDISLMTKEESTSSETKLTGKILWGVIILVIALLGFFSVRMIKEMGKKE